METKQMKLSDWTDRYLKPVMAHATNQAPATQEMEDGFAGFILDGILAVKDIAGEEANDWECVELVEELIKYAQMCVEELYA